jgi:GAF domain-containing protein
VKISNIVKHARSLDNVLQQTVRLLRAGIPHYHWVGVYMVEGDGLVLRAWDGSQATQHVRIPVGEGICGLAARSGKTINVPDVSRDPRYLECFPNTRSEIVVPILHADEVLGEIDIDSDELNAFGAEDERFLEQVGNLLGPVIRAF